MPYVPFYEKFPELAEKETRWLTLLNDPELPNDDYGLVESYCDEPECDCRRVFFNVFAARRKKYVAVIAYGWERRSFYVKWFGTDDPDTIAELQGPILNQISPQSKLAPALLQRMEGIVLKDKKYIDRLKRHYAMFRKAVEREEIERSSKCKWSAGRKSASTKRVSRNAPCPCGSGKKYKKCCGKIA